MQARLSATDLACRKGERLLFAKLGLDLGPGDMLQRDPIVGALLELDRNLHAIERRTGILRPEGNRLASISDYVARYWTFADQASPPSQ